MTRSSKALAVIFVAVIALSCCYNLPLSGATLLARRSHQGKADIRFGVASGSAPCIEEAGTEESCTSTDPTLTLKFNSESDTTGCSFSGYVEWGDGTREDWTVTGGPAGPLPFVSHTYSTSGAFTVISTMTTITGPCSGRGATYHFTLGSITGCGSARRVVERYEDLERQVDDEAQEAQRVINSALEISGEIKSLPLDQAQEISLHLINRGLDRALAQIRRAETNLTSGLWKPATIFEREWAAQVAATLRIVAEPFLEFAARVELVKLSKTLGQIAVIDAALGLHLHQLESSKADYEIAKHALRTCTGSRAGCTAHQVLACAKAV
jgi:hypothetical protein